MQPRPPVRRLLLTADTADGSWAYAVELARGLAGHRVGATLALLGERPPAADLARARAVPGLHLLDTGLPGEAGAGGPGELRFVADALADLAGEADLVQVHSPALAASARFRAPVVAVARGCPAAWWSAARAAPLPAARRWRLDLAREGLDRAAAVVAPTAAFAAVAAETYGRRPIVVRSGRRPALPAPAAEAAAPFALAVGRAWDPAEGFDVLDRALAGAPLRGMAVGTLDGPDGERPGFAALAAPGPQTAAQLARLLRGRPVFVSPARYAPDAPAALAAAQAGCALVLSDLPAHRELWGPAALYAPAGDDRALAAALQRLFDDPDLRARRGEAARARAGRYSAEAMARGLLGVYRSVLAPAAPRRVRTPEFTGDTAAVAAG